MSKLERRENSSPQGREQFLGATAVATEVSAIEVVGGDGGGAEGEGGTERHFWKLITLAGQSNTLCLMFAPW